jgi:hypothetical protein
MFRLHKKDLTKTGGGGVYLLLGTKNEGKSLGMENPPMGRISYNPRDDFSGEKSEVIKKMKRRRTKRIRVTPKRRTPWGGPYIKPRVERVKLDPKQASLSACRVGGAYMHKHGAVTSACYARGSWFNACLIAVRGSRNLIANYPTHRATHLETPS